MLSLTLTSVTRISDFHGHPQVPVTSLSQSVILSRQETRYLLCGRMKWSLCKRGKSLGESVGCVNLFNPDVLLKMFI